MIRHNIEDMGKSKKKGRQSRISRKDLMDLEDSILDQVQEVIQDVMHLITDMVQMQSASSVGTTQDDASGVSPTLHPNLRIRGDNQQSSTRLAFHENVADHRERQERGRTGSSNIEMNIGRSSSTSRTSSQDSTLGERVVLTGGTQLPQGMREAMRTMNSARRAQAQARAQARMANQMRMRAQRQAAAAQGSQAHTTSQRVGVYTSMRPPAAQQPVRSSRVAPAAANASSSRATPARPSVSHTRMAVAA